MLKFKKLNIECCDKNQKQKNINYIAEIYNLYKSNLRFLNDDYTNIKDYLDEVIGIISKTSPYF